MYSMTAFSSLEEQGPYGVLSWELRSVNHRFLDISVRLPDEFRDLEPVVRDRIGARIRRGKCECALKYKPPAPGEHPLRLDETRLEQLLAAVRRIEDLLGNRPNRTIAVNPMDLLGWPGLIEADTADLKAAKDAARKLFGKVLDGFCTARNTEGEKIHPLLASRCQIVLDEVAGLRTVLPEIVDGQRKRLRERLDELSARLDEGRLEQEIAVIAQRTDVHEELDRVDLHVEEVQRLLDADEPVGRRLDFLMQELNREANTLASKSQDMRLTRVALELKVVIEQMREQIQNVE